MKNAKYALILLTFSGLLIGCAHVKPEELDTRLADLQTEIRQEMEEGDVQVARELGARMDGMEGRLADLERELDVLAREFDATVERLETALRFNTPVYFGFDEAELRPQDRPLLDRFAQVVREYYPDCLITVEGFTDSSGSQAYNERLGQRRAEAVKTYLVEEAGLSSANLRAVSYGEGSPRQVAQGETGPGAQGWENRRVALVVDHAPDPSGS